MPRSVRAMQYVLDMSINAKNPDDLVHLLPYKCYRTWPLVLWPLPEDFEKLAYPENFFLKFVVFELATMSCKMSLLFFLRKLNYIYLRTHTK